MGDRSTFWARMGKFVRPEIEDNEANLRKSSTSRPPAARTRTPRTSQYEIARSEELIDDLFLKLRDRVYAAEESGTRPGILPKMMRETGVMDPDRLYFFLKPFSQDGLLFERSGAGWITSRADKIVSGDTFIRETEPLDQVTVYRPRSGEGTIRITSVMLDLDKVSFSIYAQLIAEQIGSIWKQN